MAWLTRRRLPLSRRAVHDAILASLRFQTIYERFIQDPCSPWNASPWAMDLKVAKPLPINANQYKRPAVS
jgi:hypothetical protein